MAQVWNAPHVDAMFGCGGGLLRMVKLTLVTSFVTCEFRWFCCARLMTPCCDGECLSFSGSSKSHGGEAAPPAPIGLFPNLFFHSFIVGLLASMLGRGVEKA